MVPSVQGSDTGDDVCSSVMSVHPEGGASVRDTRVSLISVDMVSKLAKSCWMSTITMVCRGSRC